MTDEQINEIVLINKIIEKCYLKALSHDTDINSKHELRKIAKWLGEIEKNWERIDRQNAEIEKLKQELDGETVKNMRLGHEIDGLKEKNIGNLISEKKMSECRFCIEEVCSNTKCPLMGELCPVIGKTGVCKFEQCGEILFEKIKKMSIEELSEFLSYFTDDTKIECTWCEIKYEGCPHDRFDCCPSLDIEKNDIIKKLLESSYEGCGAYDCSIDK